MSKPKQNIKSATNITRNGQDRFYAFIQLRKLLTQDGFFNPYNISKGTIYQNLNGFRFDLQNGTGNRRHYALQQNGITNGFSNIVTITINNINDQSEVKAMLQMLNTFQANAFMKKKCCYDFQV